MNVEKETGEEIKGVVEAPPRIKPFFTKMTSKQLIADLKRLQHKHGVFPVVALDTKKLAEGIIAPAEMNAVCIRGAGNVLNHVILTDAAGSALVTGNKDALMESEIIEAASETIDGSKAVEPKMDPQTEEDKAEVVNFPKKGSEDNPLGY